jgi:hypothetical protein
MIKACSNSQGCVWVGLVPGDEVDPELIWVSAHNDVSAPHVTFTREEWETFLAGVAAGLFTVENLRLDPFPLVIEPGSLEFRAAGGGA